MQNRKTKVNADIMAREERRGKVVQYMQQSLTEAEIAERLNVDTATVSRHVQVLKKTAQDFIYSLAKET
jgi:DNA-binding NarL/FixJ family response regulator